MKWNRVWPVTGLAAAVFLHGLFAGCTAGGQSDGSSSVTIDSTATEGVTTTAYDLDGMDFTYTDRDLDGNYTTAGATAIAFDGETADVSGDGASAADGVVTIDVAGTYILSGSYTGRIVVRAADTDKIQIVLNNVSISSSNHSALFIEQADKVFLTLAEGSQNTFSDGSAYELASGEENVDGSVFSRADLTINGSGALTVQGNYNHGIVSKDDLVITGGVLTVTASGDGMQGKDCVKICGGTIAIDAGGDGIKSSNSEEATRGFVSLDGGALTITAGQDGVQAETVLRTAGGTVHLTTGGGSANASVDSSGNAIPEWGNWARGSMNGMTSPMAAAASSQITEAQDASTSAKGLKAGGLVWIENGSFVIDSSDDSLHSNGNITIDGGTFDIASGDDGVHADTALVINGGEIAVSKSYEGLEGSTVDITGGMLSVTASDDGMNAAGGNDGSSMNGRPGQNNFNTKNGMYLRISGGYLVIDASGDGLDSNGALTIEGGTVLVCGPTDSANGAMDCEGACEITGGVVVCVGSSGMAMGFSSSSSQTSLMYTFGSAKEGGTSIALTDESGTVLASFTPGKSYQNVVISAPGMAQGSSYNLITGGTATDEDGNGYATTGTVSGGDAVSVILSSVSTAISENGSSTGGMGGNMGDMAPNGNGGGTMPPGGQR